MRCINYLSRTKDVLETSLSFTKTKGFQRFAILFFYLPFLRRNSPFSFSLTTHVIMNDNCTIINVTKCTQIEHSIQRIRLDEIPQALTARFPSIYLPTYLPCEDRAVFECPLTFTFTGIPYASSRRFIVDFLKLELGRTRWNSQGNGKITQLRKKRSVARVRRASFLPSSFPTSYTIEPRIKEIFSYKEIISSY